MSFTDIRPYFRTRLDAISLQEHKDGFNFENLPRTRFNRFYHIGHGTTVSELTNQSVVGSSSEVIIRVFLKGFRVPADAIDAGFDLADDIIKAVSITTDRLCTGSIRNVAPAGIEIEPLSDSNDNSAILIMSFNVLTYLDTDV